MKKHLNLILVAAGLLMSSCNEEQVPVPDKIRITAELGTASKALAENGVYNSFEKGDAISVFVWTSAQTVVDNVLNRFEGESKWKADSPMSWTGGEAVAHDFMAVYPKIDLKMPAAKMQGSYAAVGGKVEDVLVARVSGQMPTSEPVKLTFDHAMSFIEVDLNLRSEYDGVDPSSVYVTAEVATDALVDYVAVSSSATGTADDYRLSASAKGLSHSAVLPAQTLPMNIVVHIGNLALSLKREGLELELISGKVTKVKLNVGKDVVEISGISVNDWKTGGPIFGETE